MVEIKRFETKLNTAWLISGYRLKLLLGFLITSLCLIVVTILTFPDSNLHIKFFDVGEGDSIFIRTPTNYKVLIDGGPDNHVLQHLGREMPFYDRKIDLIILTHAHADHLTGLLEVVKRYQVDQVWIDSMAQESDLYQFWLETLKKEKLKVGHPKVGDYLDFGDGVVLKILWPKEGSLVDEDLNESSFVSLLTYDRFSVLLPGDAGEKSQPYYEGKVTVLKVPHQGARTALEETFLKILAPSLAVISVGGSNTYGHPAEETLSKLHAIHSQIFRTDEDGSIEVVSDGRTWYTKTER